MITHLVDSDWVIDYLNERPQAFQILQPLLDQRVLAISIVAYGEIYEGVLRNPQSAGGLAGILSGVTLMGVDRETAELFAQIRADLRARGELLADHDIWIASTALRHDLSLLSRDQHFDRIDALKRS